MLSVSEWLAGWHRRALARPLTEREREIVRVGGCVSLTEGDSRVLVLGNMTGGLPTVPIDEKKSKKQVSPSDRRPRVKLV